MSPAARKMLLKRPNVYSLEELFYDRNKIAEKIGKFTAPQDGGIGFPDPLLKASLGSLSQQVWMLNAGEDALTIADRILALDKAGNSSLLQERVNSPVIRSFVSSDRNRKPVMTGMYVDEVVYDNEIVDADLDLPRFDGQVV